MQLTAHRRMRRAVAAYLDGEPSPVRPSVVQAHLGECWGCSGDADTLRLMKWSLRRLADRQPTDLVAVRLRRWVQEWRS